MAITRVDRIALWLVVLGGWGIGTLASLVAANTSLFALVLNAWGTAGGIIAMRAAVTARSGWVWVGTALAAAACAVAVLATLAGAAIWLPGVCWIFVIVAGLVAVFADTAPDTVLQAALGGLAVGPVLLQTRSDSGLWIVVFLAAGCVATSITVGYRHRAATERLKAARAEVQMAERLSMARELHDVIAHEVAGIVVLAQAGIAAGTDRDGTLTRIERSGARALADIRAMVGTLRQPGEASSLLATPTSGGLRATLADFADASIDIDVDPGVDADDVPDLARLVAHRVVSEGITNARRHAPGSHVRVRVARVDRALHVDVIDNGATAGAPAGPGPGSGVGLIGLIERVATIRGGRALRLLWRRVASLGDPAVLRRRTGRSHCEWCTGRCTGALTWSSELSWPTIRKWCGSVLR